jgi:S-formylglutathione hydrolase FrmB
MQFIVETLKPYVDQHYRTLAGREHTAVMGSSMGALISHYGLLAYPDVFSKAGIFSASYWFSDSVWTFTHEAGHHDSTRIYMMCGSGEGQGTINDMAAMQDSLIAIGFAEQEIDLTIIPGGQHNESLWGQEFGNAYRWLYKEYASHIFENEQYQTIIFYPNPAGHIISLPVDFPDSCDSMKVFDMLGNQVSGKSPFNGKEIDLSGLNPGTYLIVLIHDGKYFQGKIVLE